MNEALLQRKLTRERNARQAAEAFLEAKSRELFNTNLQLQELAKELSHKNEKHQAILDNAAEGIVTFTANGIITTFNRAAVELFGVNPDDVIGSSFARLFVDMEVDNDEFRIPDLPAGCLIHEYVHKSPEQQELIIEITFSKTDNRDEAADAFIAILRDRTKHKFLESQLALASKMESVGQLAAGIAHEINTPIQYVGDNARFLRDAFDDLRSLINKYQSTYENGQQPASETRLEQLASLKAEVDLDFLIEEIPLAIEQSLIGTERVAKIARAMKEFSHPGTDSPVAVDINSSLTSCSTVSRNEWKYIAEMEFDLDTNLPKVFCFPSDMNQVFLNLIVNAAHAIESKKKQLDQTDFAGKITVSTRLNGESVEIEIEDNGCGIPDHLVSRIFDPFFTTKDVGVGTGQGLAIVHKIISEKHQGKLRVKSVPMAGTTMTIQLPLSLEPIAAT